MASGGEKPLFPQFINPSQPAKGDQSDSQQIDTFSKNGKFNQKPPDPQEEGKSPQDQGTKTIAKTLYFFK